MCRAQHMHRHQNNRGPLHNASVMRGIQEITARHVSLVQPANSNTKQVHTLVKIVQSILFHHKLRQTFSLVCVTLGTLVLNISMVIVKHVLLVHTSQVWGQWHVQRAQQTQYLPKLRRQLKTVNVL